MNCSSVSSGHADYLARVSQKRSDEVVLYLTGHGLKDPDTAIKQCTEAMITVDAELEPVREAIVGNLS